MATPVCQVNLTVGKLGAEKSLCPNEGAYLAFPDDCYGSIHVIEFDACRGHRVCEEHGALLRTTALRDGDPATPNGMRPPVLARICTLESAASDREAGD